MAKEPTSEELQRFYTERVKPSKQGLFKYDEKGNLVEYNKTGQLKKTITLPTYRPPTAQEIKEMEEERNEKIQIANRTFEDARRRLYQALQDVNRPRAEILEINREVRDADIMLQSARFPLRTVTYQEGVKIKEMMFDQPTETRVFPYEIAFSNLRPYTLQQQYVRVGELGLPPMVSVLEAQQAEKPVETVILVSDQDMETSPNGFLALSWPVSIRLGDKQYASARHPIFSELAMEFGHQERANTIQAAETGDDIHYSVDDVGRETNQTKWNMSLSRLIDSVQLQKFRQYPELALRLMELPAGTIIGMYEPNDIQMGIGLSVNNVKARDRFSWTGENWIGKSLMKIRDTLLVERAQAAQAKPKRVPKPTSVAVPQQVVSNPIVEQIAPVQVTAPQPPANETIMSRAVAFLSMPEATEKPLEKRVDFLRKQQMTNTNITEAFKQAYPESNEWQQVSAVPREVPKIKRVPRIAPRPMAPPSNM